MRSLGSLSLLPLLLLSLACSTPQRAIDDDALHAEGPGTLFTTVEAAVIDAMLHAHTSRFPAGRPHVLAGAIQRVDGGFRYAAPETSDRHSALSPPVAHFRLGPNDVASYLVYSRVDERSLDRQTAKLILKARHITDDVDPLHRPVYLLTPSLTIVAYDGTTARTLSRLEDARPTTLAASRR